MELQTAYQVMRRYFAAMPEGEPARAANNNGTCAYRTPTGKRCAVGCLIPDSLYFPALEACGSVHGLLNPELYELAQTENWQKGDDQRIAEVVDFLGITQNNLGDWRTLQEAHDLSGDADGPTIAANLDNAAFTLGLDTPRAAAKLRDEAQNLLNRADEIEARF